MANSLFVAILRKVYIVLFTNRLQRLVIPSSFEFGVFFLHLYPNNIRHGSRLLPSGNMLGILRAVACLVHINPRTHSKQLILMHVANT